MRHISTLLTLCSILPLAAADDLRGPALGSVWDNGQQSLRALRGIPGSASWGTPAKSAESLLVVAIAPGGSSGLAITSKGVLVTLASDGALKPIEGAKSNATNLVWSPTGRYAVAADNTFAQLISADGTLTGTSWDWSDLPGDTNALAISDSGDFLVARGNDLYRRVSDAWQPVGLNAAATAVAYLPDNRAVAATAERLWLVNQSAVDALSDTAGATVLAPSRDGKLLFALLTEGQILRLDLSTRDQQILDCQCHPTGLTPLAGNAVFRLTDLTDAPLLLLHDNQILFVPARK